MVAECSTCERKVSNLIEYFMDIFVYIYFILGPLQPNGCKLSTLLTV